MDVLRMLLDFGELYAVGVDLVVYAVLAIGGTSLFLIRLVLSLLLGVDAGDEMDLDAADAGDGFGFFSFLSITAFAMGAGWMGLTARIDWGLGVTGGAFASAGFGGAMMLLSSALLYGARKLNREVTYDIKSAVGRTGQCYTTVPASGEGSGSVRVSVSGRSMVVPAVSNGPKVESFADVKVVGARDDRTLIVEPL